MAEAGPKQRLKWPMMVVQAADDAACCAIEGAGDWRGSGATQRRREFPEQVEKLIAVCAPTKAALVSWRDDFAQGCDFADDDDERPGLGDLKA